MVMSNSYPLRTKEEMRSSFEEKKEQMREAKIARDLAGEKLSGVVIASKIAEAIENEGIDSCVTPELGRELAETVQRAERETNDVEVLTVPPTERLIPGKVIFINLPGNATSLTDNDHNPLEKAKVKTAAMNAVDDFFDFIGEDGELKKKDCQCVGCYYSHKINGLIEDYNKYGAPHDGIEQFSHIFDDLVSRDGRKIDVNEAVSNMKKVILRGQCFGTLVASELEKLLHLKLAFLGYSHEECVKILSAPTALFSSSPVALDKQPQYFKIVAYANCADTLIPTLKGSPNYQEQAGFTDEEIKSEEFQIREQQLRPNYKLILCSSLDLPEVEDLAKRAKEGLKNPTQEKIDFRVSKMQNGHAFSAVAHPFKKYSPFMQKLRMSVHNAMSSAVSEIADYCVICQVTKELGQRISNFKHGIKGHRHYSNIVKKHLASLGGIRK